MSFTDKAVSVLQKGGIILVPTDTHFALAADPFCPDAVSKLMLLKTSLSVKDITLCFCDLTGIWAWVEVSQWQRNKIEVLSRAFWPGTLKVHLQKRQQEAALPGEGNTVSVVCVKNHQMRNIISRLGRPLMVIPAGAQQHTGGLVSFTIAREDLGDWVDLVVPSNSKNLTRQATTHISLLNDQVSILRRGELDISALL
ncbi:L-threonylcarbamoyladenylate synthase [Scandinavium sp. NPDC088450]|uniref:L-threonylcarbamoyladenylate synthase n=1 Tax=Scandinavium sp. NPDC088450 TaxID=3364514 RepID=UPI0038513462